ncbi:MAG: hypothetical protein M0T71_10390, partial [Actinomycetota bacterium]|nr:hypothetical protein [Actinomycetota bacterium]
MERADPHGRGLAQRDITLGIVDDPLVGIFNRSEAVMTRCDPPVEVAGPLAQFKNGFVAHLVALGYVSSGLAGQRALFGHLDRWLDAAGLRLAELTPSALEEFLQSRRAGGYTTKLTARGLAPLLDFLAHLQLF